MIDFICQIILSVLCLMMLCQLVQDIRRGRW